MDADGLHPRTAQRSTSPPTTINHHPRATKASQRMSQARPTDREANFPQVEEGRAMPTQRKDTEFKVTTKHCKHGKLTPRKCSAVQRASQATHSDQIEAQATSDKRAQTKANRNGVNRSGQVRRKAKTDLFNNR
jgi:hypothetical protein